MTNEEAGEVILSGKAWIECKGCVGTGIRNTLFIVGLKCPSCSGWGYIPSSEYVLACRITGTNKLPIKPSAPGDHILDEDVGLTEDFRSQ